MTGRAASGPGRALGAPAVALGLLLAVAGACGGEPEATDEPAADVVPAAMDAPVADTTAEAVWAHLQAESYRDSWASWPDRPGLYAGTQPHGMLLATYLNERAARGLERIRAGDEQTLPFGAIVVKENYAPDSSLVATTVMYKQERYDPDHHDWFWMKRLADGTVEASGRVESCIGCHEQAAETQDYLMTDRDTMGSG